MNTVYPSNVLPLTAQVDSRGHLIVGGCDTVDLVQQFGTPLYVYDENTIRTRCRQYTAGLKTAYPDSLVLYASKAFTCPGLLRIVREEGLGLDVVSGGELFVAIRSEFPLDRVYFHGNNKSRSEIMLALEHGVGRFVVDSFHEIDLLDDLCSQLDKKASVLLRLSPGVEAHTHDYRKTGILDSKFGFPILTGQAEEAVRRAMASPRLDLVGLHAHVGSQIFELEPYRECTRTVIEFAAKMRDTHGFTLREFSPGGGWGIAYTREDDPMEPDEVATYIGQMVREEVSREGLPEPRLFIEPGRSIVGQACVALYTVGAIKEIPGIRTYVSVDGGMADNIRPALYGSRYEALLANRMADAPTTVVTIAGKYCESGDVLVRDVALPAVRPGDIVALPASGAYNLAMSSNYNMAPRPAVLLVADGQVRVLRRRETYEDLILADVL